MQSCRTPWTVWCCLLLTLESGCLAFLFCSKVSPRVTVWQRRTRSVVPVFAVSNNYGSDNTRHHPILLIRLPIFPLRKFPKVPTDSLTLNLYEDRYLQMSKEAILPTMTRSGSSVLGALYVADLPQIVPKGRGPITPIVQVGLIGTLFMVEDFQLDDIPTVRQDFNRQQRARLNARGVARFRIDTIVSDGTGLPLDEVEGGKKEDLPYLLVNATLVSDNAQLTFEGSLDVVDLIDGFLRQKESERLLWNPFLLTPRRPTSTQEILSEFETIVWTIQRLMSSELWCWDHTIYRNELLSFFLASQLTSAGKQQRPKDMVPLLKMTSTQQRLDAFNHRANL
jgi:Lon protease-like protein